MPQVLIGIGSNIEPEKHLKLAAHEIRKHFPDALFSGVYQSPSMGMDGDDFLNACCLLHTGISEPELVAWLKKLEDMLRRDRSKGSWQPRTIDLDLLMLDGTVIDDDLLHYPHAYMPASELLELELPADERQVLKRLSMRL